MSRLFNITNHAITAEQRSDAEASLGIGEVVETPPTISHLWGSIPPELDSVREFVRPVLDWLESQTLGAGDVVWVQGEWGGVFAVVDWCRTHSVRCVYATTRREAQEIHTEGGVQMVHLFRHVRFRDFPGTST